MDTPRPPSRQCGTCTACCTAEGVHELHKPPAEACQFVGSQGCGNYDNRPESCRQFRCLWLDGVFDEDARPDGLDVVFSMTPAPASMHPWRRYIRVMESVSGAASRPRCQQLIRWLVDKGEIVWVYGAESWRTGDDVRVHYPDGVVLTMRGGLTFEQELAQIEAMQKGVPRHDAASRFATTPTPQPRPAHDWLRHREARRVIERGKPIAAVQRIFDALHRGGGETPPR